jgi:hypothetical protein
MIYNKLILLIKMIRVGRITNPKKHPTFEGFIPIVVMTLSSKYGHLGPYGLMDEHGHIMENIWQFSKVYQKVPYTLQLASRWDKRIIWEYPAEVHVDDNGHVNDNYWFWRRSGMNMPDAIRYPVGFNHRHEVLYSLWETEEGYKKLNYVEARKEIYVKVYSKLVKQHETFNTLVDMLKEGKNLLILEVDGPHQESLPYYKNNYQVDDNFIQQDTMLATTENLDIMLNDTKHCYGHGYVLASCLLDHIK